MFRKLISLSAGSIACMAAFTTAHADEAPAEKPAWIKELTPAVLGPHQKLPPIKLEYTASWKGLVDAGNLEFTFGATPADGSKDYLVQAYGASTGLAKSLFEYKVAFVNKLAPATLRSLSAKTIEVDEKAKTSYATLFKSSGVDCEETTYRFKQKSTQVDKKTFAFAPVLDVFSAMLHVRSMPLKDGDTLKFVIFPTDRAYLLSIQVVTHEWFQNQNAIKLKVSMQKIADNLTLLPYKKMTTTYLWLSDDTRRIPLEIRSEVFIGDVRVTLKNTTSL